MKWKAAEPFKQGLLSLGSRGVGRGIHEPLDLSLWRGKPRKGDEEGANNPLPLLSAMEPWREKPQGNSISSLPNTH